MKKRNLSLRELKNEIENKIQNIDTKDATDETKYNIYLCTSFNLKTHQIWRDKNR